MDLKSGKESAEKFTEKFKNLLTNPNQDAIMYISEERRKTMTEIIIIIEMQTAGATIGEILEFLGIDPEELEED